MPDPFCGGWTLQLELQTCSALLSRASHRVLHIVKMLFHFILYLYFKTTLMAQKTDAARKRGGSPTALLEYTALGFDAALKIQLGNHTPRHCCRCHCLPEQADVELGRHVVETWDLVSAWTSG